MVTNLKCTHENNQVVVRAPLNLEPKTYRKVAIEPGKKVEAIKQ